MIEVMLPFRIKFVIMLLVDTWWCALSGMILKVKLLLLSNEEYDVSLVVGVRLYSLEEKISLSGE